MIRRIAAHPYRWILCVTGLLVLLSVALNMAGPLLLRGVIDDAMPRHDTRLLIVFCTAMIASGVLGTGIAMALNVTTNWIGQRVVHGLRLDVYDRVQCMPLDFFATEPPAEIQARMASDIGGISDVITYTATSTLAAAVSLLAAGLAMLVLSWPLAAFCLIMSVVLGMFNRRFNSVRRELADQRQERAAQLLRLVEADLILSGIILGRTFLRYSSRRLTFCATSKEVGDLTYRQRVAGSTARGAIGLTISCLPPLLYLLARTAVHSLSLGTAIVMVTLQMRFTVPLQQLLSLNGRMQSSQAMFRRVFDYLDLPTAVALDTRSQGKSVWRAGHASALQVRGVWHRYPESGRIALAGIVFDISPGSTTVIMGQTGSGKTTLALIMAGLVAPGGGALRVGAVSSQVWQWRVAASHDLWRAVTLVPQESVMFSTSIREDLLFARPDATDTELLWVTAAMQIGDLIAGLPASLDTVVGGQGYQHSGGERQRLALARALLAPGQILIADEATSALDNATAAAVHAQLREHCQVRSLSPTGCRSSPPMIRLSRSRAGASPFGKTISSSAATAPSTAS